MDRMSIGVDYQDARSYLYIVANYYAVVNSDACATHTYIIANNKLYSWPIFNLLHRLATTVCLEFEGSYQTLRQAPLISAI